MIPLILGAAAAGASIFGAVSSYNSSKNAASQQRRLGQANAAYIGEETEEQVRRTRLGQGQIQGTTKARSAASGLQGKSRENYMAQMKQEHQRELDWLWKSAESRQKIARYGGGIAANATLASGQASLFGGLGNAAATFGSAYSQYKASQ